jgi:zinc protease
VVRWTETVRLIHEDNFAQLPQLTLTWPSVPQYHPDSYALELLARILTDGRASPFYQVLVEELELAPGASAFQRGSELAGSFTLQVRAYPDIDLDDVRDGIEAGLRPLRGGGGAPRSSSSG